MGGVDHEDGEFVLDRWIVGFLDVRTVHVEGFLGAEEGGIVTHGVAELGVVEVRWGWWWLWVWDIEKIDVGDWTTVR